MMTKPLFANNEELQICKFSVTSLFSYLRHKIWIHKELTLNTCNTTLFFQRSKSNWQTGQLGSGDINQLSFFLNYINLVNFFLSTSLFHIHNANLLASNLHDKQLPQFYCFSGWKAEISKVYFNIRYHTTMTFINPCKR